MENTLEEKQSYLRKEILEGGLDGNKFMVFLNKSNPKRGEDLDQWSLEELVGIVEAFKPAKDKQNEDSLSKKIEQQLVESPLKKPSPLEDNTYFQSIQCESKQMNTIYMKDKKLDIKITKWQKNQGGFLEKSYVRFTISIPELEVKVYRRYSEFEWLKNTLKLLYPGLPIPPLPKKGKVIRAEEKYLNKRMYLLQKFLNQLATMPEIASDMLFERFITIAQPKQFQKIKQLYSKIDNVPLRKIKTIKGTIDIGTEKEITQKVSKCLQYMKETQPELKKIYKNFKGVATNFQQAAEFMKGTASNCEFLGKKEQDLRIRLNLPPSSEKNAFLLLGSFATDFAHSLTSFAKTFRRQIYSLAKYESFYKLNMIEATEQLNQMQQDYLQAKFSLLKKKEKLFSEGKMAKWGLRQINIPKPATKNEAFQIMLPKQTAELLTHRQNYALHNVQIFEEYFRHTRDFNRYFLPPLQDFLQLQLKISTHSTQSLNNLMEQVREASKQFLGP